MKAIESISELARGQDKFSGLEGIYYFDLKDRRQIWNVVRVITRRKRW
jgi:hypothetical protein